MSRSLNCVHVWEEIKEGTHINCKACCLMDSNPGHKCKLCGLSYHSDCMSCPQTISLSGNRVLKLYRAGPTPDRKCDVCEGIIQGNFYHLENGNFDAHPLCFLNQETSSSTTTQSRDSDGVGLVGAAVNGIKVVHYVMEGLSYLFSDA